MPRRRGECPRPVDSRSFVGYPRGMSLPLHRPAPKARRREAGRRRRVERLALAAAPSADAARRPRGVRRAHRRGAARRGAGARAVSRRHHAVLRVAHGPGARRLPGAHAGHSARQGGAGGARRVRRSARRGRPVAGAVDRASLSRSRALARARSLRVYCRHCNRRRLVGQDDGVISVQRLEAGARLRAAHAADPRRAHLGRRSADAVDGQARVDRVERARHRARRHRAHRHAGAGGCRCASTTSW